MPIASKKPHPEVPSPPAAELARCPAPTPATVGRRLWIRGDLTLGSGSRIRRTGTVYGLSEASAARGPRDRSGRRLRPVADRPARRRHRLAPAMIREGRLEALDRPSKMALRRGHVFAKRRLP